MVNASHWSRARLASKLAIAATLAGALISSSACSSDDAPAGSPDGGSDETGGKGSGGKSTGGAANTGGKAAGGTSGTGAGGASGAGAGDSGTCTGGPSKGTNDADHCKAPDGGAITQVIGACVKEGEDAGHAHEDAGAEPGDGGDVDDYGDTLYGAEGDDDDCKYHVKYTVAPICQDEGVTFVITLTKTADGKPATGAAPYVEATLNDLPASVADKQKITEKANGVYEVGPVVFDKSGKWNTRFHFYESCSDSEDSPHGHVAFFMDVP